MALLVAGCAGRPLTENERDFASVVIGPTLDLDKVRVAQGFGIIPPPNAAWTDARVRPVKADPIEGFCDRTAPQAASGPPPAWALYQGVHFIPNLYRPDIAAGWPDQALFPEALIFAHELVHVWQWQNRRITGYRPARSALESVVNIDPYFYVPRESAQFLQYGFEQQAALLEDYLCYALYDPQNARRDDLRAILIPFFPLGRLDAALGQ